METTPTYNLTNITDPFNMTSLPVKHGITALQIIGIILIAIAILGIIMVNGLYLVCFYINRKKRWVILSKNILSLVVVDLLVGLSAFLLTTAASLKNVNFYYCVSVQVLSMSSQIASSLNVFRICIVRLIATKQRTQMQTKYPSTFGVIIQTMFVFIVAVLLISVAMFIWTAFSPNLDKCVWSQIFKDHSQMVDKYMLVVILLPVVLTTVLYSFLYWNIRTTKRIVPSDSQTVASTTQENKRQQDNVLVSNTGRENIQIIPNATNVENVVLNTVHGSAKNDNLTSTTTSQFDRIVAKSQKRYSEVFVTIGLILMCVNISVLPYTIALAIKIYNYPATNDGSFYYIASFILLLNSAVNPTIYAIRIKHLREAFVDLISSLFRSMLTIRRTRVE